MIADPQDVRWVDETPSYKLGVFSNSLGEWFINVLVDQKGIEFAKRKMMERRTAIYQGIANTCPNVEEIYLVVHEKDRVDNAIAQALGMMYRAGYKGFAIYSGAL